MYQVYICTLHTPNIRQESKVHKMSNNWVSIETYNVDLPRSLKISFFIRALIIIHNFTE